MAHCGSRPGYCGHKADCPDTLCPGRGNSLQFGSLPMRICNGVAMPIEAEPEEEHPIDRCPVGVTALVFITVAALAGLFLLIYHAFYG